MQEAQIGVGDGSLLSKEATLEMILLKVEMRRFHAPIFPSHHALPPSKNKMRGSDR